MAYISRGDLAGRLGLREEYLPDVDDLVALEPGKPTISAGELADLCRKFNFNFETVKGGFHILPD